VDKLNYLWEDLLNTLSRLRHDHVRRYLFRLLLLFPIDLCIYISLSYRQLFIAKQFHSFVPRVVVMHVIFCEREKDVLPLGHVELENFNIGISIYPVLEHQTLSEPHINRHLLEPLWVVHVFNHDLLPLKGLLF
jgi:hypothetical protein